MSKVLKKWDVKVVYRRFKKNEEVYRQWLNVYAKTALDASDKCITALWKEEGRHSPKVMSVSVKASEGVK